MSDDFYRSAPPDLRRLLATNGTGSFGQWDIWLMIVDLGIGTVGLFDPDATESD